MEDYRWVWLSDDGTVRYPFADAQNTVLEQCYVNWRNSGMAGPSTVQLAIGKNTYTVDVEDLEQRNMATGRIRKIMRITMPKSVAPTNTTSPNRRGANEKREGEALVNELRSAEVRWYVENREKKHSMNSSPHGSNASPGDNEDHLQPIVKEISDFVESVFQRDALTCAVINMRWLSSPSHGIQGNSTVFSCGRAEINFAKMSFFDSVTSVERAVIRGVAVDKSKRKSDESKREQVGDGGTGGQKSTAIVPTHVGTRPTPTIGTHHAPQLAGFLGVTSTVPARTVNATTLAATVTAGGGGNVAHLAPPQAVPGSKRPREETRPLSNSINEKEEEQHGDRRGDRPRPHHYHPQQQDPFPKPTQEDFIHTMNQWRMLGTIMCLSSLLLDQIHLSSSSSSSSSYSNTNTNTTRHPVFTVTDLSHVAITDGVAGNSAGPQRRFVRVAAFDMDDTLIRPKTGKVFPTSSDDWTFLHPNVPIYLRRLWREEGFCVVIFSNQSGISKNGGRGDASKAREIQQKICAVGNALGIPLSAWVSTTEDENRKPRLGMWQHFVSTLPAGVAVDMSKSFYCGDAAGRRGPTLAGRAKDFSCSDRKFASNVGLIFKTPEMFFTGRLNSPMDEAHDWDGRPSPAELTKIPKSYPPSFVSQLFNNVHGTELVIFVGYPGSGKSTFFRRFFEPRGYVHVNRDTLGDAAKCVAAAREKLGAGRSVVVDNTSPSPDDRAKYISVARQLGVKTIRVFFFKTSKDLANHMNRVREACGILPKHIPDLAYRMYETRFVYPNPSIESFDALVEVPPIADFAGLPPSVRDHFFMLW